MGATCLITSNRLLRASSSASITLSHHFSFCIPNPNSEFGSKLLKDLLMESFGSRLAIILLLHVFLLLLSAPVYCDDEENNLLQGINSFRQSAGVPALTKHDKANCVADKIANQLEDQHCASNTLLPTQSQLMSNYPSVLKKCDVDVNTTRDGMVIPVCVPRRLATLVLANYTQSRNSRYLNDSRFTGAGIGAEDDWTVLVLTTRTPGGSFASGAHRYLPSMFFFMLFMSLIY